MSTPKKNGAYYTPELLANFALTHVSSHFKNRKKLSILEPSVGDGSFIRSFNKTIFPKSIKHFTFHAVEKIKPELRKAEDEANINRKKNVRFVFEKNDFLKYQKTINRKYSLIAGNPPYIKKSLLNKNQVALCEKIHTSAGLTEKSIKNIWPYFLIRSCQLLDDNGVLAFVLPAELLQVNFSEQLRKYLKIHFQRTEIFTFDDLLFECKGQDTVLLIAYKQHQYPGQFYSHINDMSQLDSTNFVLKENKALTTTQTKWTHHLLSSDELTFLHRIASSLKTINQYCDSKPGIVTAANNFFIVNEETERLYKLSAFVRPIIQKSFFVNGSIVFSKKEFNQIAAQGRPTKILCISDEEADLLPTSVKNYLKIGVDLELPDGYKCSKRNNWFVVPNISSIPDGFFFRRIHQYPKLLKNDAKVLVTDTAYKIKMRNEYQINDLIYSFYNTLSLTFAELSGRYYGGGVLEITPKEFKNLPVPNVSISKASFNNYKARFEKKETINNILSIYDFPILNASLGLNQEEIERIRDIYFKLVSKRLRKQV